MRISSQYLTRHQICKNYGLTRKELRHIEFSKDFPNAVLLSWSKDTLGWDADEVSEYFCKRREKQKDK